MKQDLKFVEEKNLHAVYGYCCQLQRELDWVLKVGILARGSFGVATDACYVCNGEPTVAVSEWDVLHGLFRLGGVSLVKEYLEKTTPWI